MLPLEVLYLAKNIYICSERERCIYIILKYQSDKTKTEVMFHTYTIMKTKQTAARFCAQCTCCAVRPVRQHRKSNTHLQCGQRVNFIAQPSLLNIGIALPAAPRSSALHSFMLPRLHKSRGYVNAHSLHSIYSMSCQTGFF